MTLVNSAINNLCKLIVYGQCDLFFKYGMSSMCFSVRYDTSVPPKKVRRKDMSVCDPYLELQLYLEQAQDEITQAFEQPSLNTKLFKSKIDYISDDGFFDVSKSKDWNKVESCKISNVADRLTQFSFTDEGNASALSNDEEGDRNYQLNKNNYTAKESSLYDDDVFHDVSVQDFNDSFQCKLINESNSTNTTGTQTSPSQSSTNLTCWSDCSSPCKTPIDQESASDCVSADELDLSYSIRLKGRAWPLELTTKSSSAPVLKRAATNVNKQVRSQSDRHLSEIEATEACKWLRAAGFPQYAQMYEDQQFPVDVSAAEQDHPMLEPSVLKSLFRRLQALNRCAHLHQQRVTHTDDSEDEQCALSYNWTYQSDLRRWSRIGKDLEIPEEWSAGILPEAPETSCSTTEHTKSMLRRMGSTRCRRRNRDGVVYSDSGSNVFDFLSKHFSSLSSAEAGPTHVSDSECMLNKKKKSRSLDKCETWSYAHSHQDRITWNTLANTQEVDESRLDLEEGGRSIATLSCTQLQVLRKLALLKLTALMEKFCPTHRTGWNWDLPKLIRKMKAPAYKDKVVFGVPLTIILQKTGSSLPKGIEEALQWLQQNAYDQVGLFRKSGVKSRIQHLKSLIETHGECVNFSEYHAYDIADMVKQYFRDLPEALLTNKLSETFLLIFQYVPEEERRQAVLCALLLMPDEHCEVLLALLKFLTNIAEHSSINQMNESNLAICFAPSLFYYNLIPSNRQGLGSPHPREIAESKAAQDCLLYFLQNCNNLFSIPKEILKQCTSTEMKESIAVQLNELGGENAWKQYLEECQTMLLREVREKGWLFIQNHYSRVEIAYKKVTDGHPLRLWKITAEVEAPPTEVLFRLLHERPKWDDDLHSTKTIAQIDKNTEVFQYTLRNVPPLPLKDYCVVRMWKTDLSKGACLIIETSVEYPGAINIPNSVRGIVLASRYLIEPCGSGKSRLIHLCRVDTRGRMPEWYHKNYGHICALYLANIQSSFKQNAVGPESKV